MERESDPRPGARDELLRGIEAFNAGEWFDCHEIMEELWIGAPDGLRPFYQGILQVAVALHHWREGNHRGALSLCASGVLLLRQVEPSCQGVDVAALIEAVERLRGALETLGPERAGELEPGLIPRIEVPRSP
jgi:predicted metal-dependent hydrolase